MITRLDPETREQLERYVNGELSNDQLDDWLTGAEYDRSLPEAERDLLAGIRLIATEVDEGRRDPEEILVAVVEALASQGEPVYASRTASKTSWQGEPALTAMPAPVQRVSI